LFGHYGDRIGRKTALIATLLLMGGATVGIGLVPGYNQIGIWGAVFLTLFRIVQVSASAASGAAVLMAGEWTDPKRRGFTTSFAALGAPGMVLANGAFVIMSLFTSEQDFSTGLAHPVSPSAGRGVRSIRGGRRETPVFAKLQEEGRVEKTPCAGDQGALARVDPDGAPCAAASRPVLHLHHLRPDLRRRPWA
jgi:hypothetical protein